MPEPTGTAITPEAAAASAATAVEAAPQSDKIDLIQQMPAGSVGTVYQAKNPKLDRVVALRQMQVPDWLDDADDLIKRILAEARTANALSHANIAQMLTGGYKGFTVFLSSEFIEGVCLRDHVKNANPGLTEAMALARQLCSAIDYAHSKQVLHYGLNFGNIKVLPDGKLKVLDFGVLRDKNVYAPPPAKRLENEHYLAPEQVKNRPVDRAANLFSVATIIYELFTTRNPFAGRHLGEVDRNITEVDTIPASSSHSRVSEPVSKVLSKALSKNPADRYSSGQQLIEALEEAFKAPVVPKAAPAGKPANGAKAATQPFSSANGKASAPRAEGTVFGGAAPAARTQTASTTRASGPATVTLKPATAKGADKLTQWRLVAVVVVGVFLLVAMAISFGNRTEVPVAPPPAKAVAQPRADTAKEEAAAPAPAEPETQPQEETPQRRQARQKTARAEAAPAPSSAPVTEGQLTVTSTPEGATIEIAGKTLDSWKTPQTIPSLAPGTYPVKVSKPGYATELRSVVIASGKQASLDFKLTAMRATLSIGGTPGASIAIDGRPTGRFTPAAFVLEPAAHSVTLRKEGYFDLTSQVKLAAGQTTSFSPNLTVAGRTDNIKIVGGASRLFSGGSHGMSRLVIRSDPKGAQVIVNGSSLPRTTPLEIQVEPGNYEIVIRKDGYKPVRRSVVAEANGKATLDEQLPR